MAPKQGQFVYFTALPNGIASNGKHRLSVSISPRLIRDQQTTLASWPGWVDWPATVASMEWRVFFTDFFGNVETYKAENVTVVSEAPSTAHWQALFPASTKVVKFEGPEVKLKDVEILDVPAAQVQDVLLGKYMDLARDVVNPDVSQLQSTYQDVNLFDEKDGGIAADKQVNSIFKSLGDKGVVRNKADTSATKLVAQTLLFHSPSLAAAGRARRAGRDVRAREVFDPGIVRPTTRPTPPQLDFHQGLSSLGNHPQLLRKLGLVVDLELNLPADLKPAQFDPKHHYVYLAPKFAEKAVSDAHQRTPDLYTRVGVLFGGFEAAATEKTQNSRPELSRGLLRLKDKLDDGRDEYDVVQVDTDGAAFKTVSFIANVAQSLQQVNTSAFQPEKLSPPTLRTAGLSIVRADRGVAHKKKLARQVELNDNIQTNPLNKPVLFDREDVTRGYVFDVFDVKTGKWFSLCERRGEAKFLRGSLPPVPITPEEGWVSTAISQGFAADDDIRRIPPALARWANGWSLVTQRPGLSLGDDEVTLEKFDPASTVRPQDLQLSVLYNAEPGSLPPQRFGRSYLVRARAVDIAGNVITSEAATALGNAQVLGPDVYRRYEPVVDPTLVPRKPMSEGESPDVIVLRSNYNTAVALTEPNDRHVYPPKIDQFRAEQHGMFDTNSGRLSAGVYALIKARENGALDAKESNGSFKHVGAVADPANNGAPYYDLPKPQFAVENGSLADLPYLPDPLARAMAFDRLPGNGRNQFKVDLYRGGAIWPNVKPVRLRVYESADFVAPQLVGDELRVGLPKGESVEVPMSSSLREEDLDKLAVWAGLSAADKASLRPDVLAGRHWALTPSRTLRLVHAVRQPLKPATFSDEFELEREIGENLVNLVGFLDTDNKSTDRVDISAGWVEKRDFLDPDDPEADWEPEKLVPVRARLRQVPIDSTSGFSYGIDEPHQLGHTRHIPEIAYETVATTRYKDHFLERTEVEFDFFNVTRTLGTKYSGSAAPAPGESGSDVAPASVVPESETVTSLDGKVRYRRGTHYTMNYEAGTITRVNNSGLNEAQVTYVKGSITRKSPNPVGKRARSAARPDPPKVLYAVPTFKRETAEGSSEKRAKHEPSGMRVYLDRPWWSSGDDEKLGVVVWPSRGQNRGKDLPKSLVPFATQRGQDPIWAGAPTSRLVRPADFTNATRIGDALSLAEVPDQQVSIAGHDVFPDMDRKLWYCDIDILPGSAYTPFIKLGLVRYQPFSLSGVELSTVVPLEFMQLYPSRVATVTKGGSGLGVQSYSVSVSGRTHRGGKSDGGAATPEHGQIIASVEQRRPETPDGDDAVGWMEIPDFDPVDLESQTAFNGITTWTRTLNVPNDGARYRIVFREYERFRPEGSTTGFNSRLVYAEAIEL